MPRPLPRYVWQRFYRCVQPFVFVCSNMINQAVHIALAGQRGQRLQQAFGNKSHSHVVSDLKNVDFGLQSQWLVTFLTTPPQTAYTIPILAFAFVCHPEVLPIYSELKE